VAEGQSPKPKVRRKPKKETPQPIPEDMYGVIRSDLSTLTTILKDDPSIADHIYDIFEEHLHRQVTGESYERLTISLRVLVGDAPARLITESAKILNRFFFEEIFKHSEDEAMRKSVLLLQHLTARYGTRVKDAFFLSFRYMEDDWRTAEVSLLRKGEGEQWFIEMDLEKYRGEEIFLRMTPVSAVQLTNLMIAEIQKIPCDAVDQEFIQQIKEGLSTMKKKYSRKVQGKETPHIDGYA
jgi:hypothetical protein